MCIVQMLSAGPPYDACTREEKTPLKWRKKKKGPCAKKPNNGKTKKTKKVHRTLPCCCRKGLLLQLGARPAWGQVIGCWLGGCRVYMAWMNLCQKKKEMDWDMGYVEHFRRRHSSRRDTSVESWGSFSILLARAQGGMRSR